MAASKAGFMKDALILFAITSDLRRLLLGVVYDITKAPIERATIEANNRTYTSTECFPPRQNSPRWMRLCRNRSLYLTESGELEGLGYGSVAIESVLEGKGRERSRHRPCHQLPFQQQLRGSREDLRGL